MRLFNQALIGGPPTRQGWNPADQFSRWPLSARVRTLPISFRDGHSQPGLEPCRSVFEMATLSQGWNPADQFSRWPLSARVETLPIPFRDGHSSAGLEPCRLVVVRRTTATIVLLRLSSRVGPLQSVDVELLHLHKRLSHPGRFLPVFVLHQRSQYRRHYLPRDAVLVFQPAALFRSRVR